MTERYESPEVKIILTKEEIHKRYQDAALTIFKVIIYLHTHKSISYIAISIKYRNNILLISCLNLRTF